MAHYLTIWSFVVKIFIRFMPTKHLAPIINFFSLAYAELSTAK